MGTLSWVRPIVTGISQRHKRKFEVTPQPQSIANRDSMLRCRLLYEIY